MGMPFIHYQTDGAYFEVVLPLLKQWHDVTEKHMDTKLVVFAGNDRLVLHAYNGTQNLMVQGKNHENLA